MQTVDEFGAGHDTGQHRDRNVDQRRADTTEHDAVGVTAQLRRGATGGLERARWAAGCRCGPTRRARARKAALEMMGIGPLLTGNPQSIDFATLPSRRASACAVPAISHSRKWALSGWRAPNDLSRPVSLSVWMSRILVS